jgi:two-component system LytT family response regulator
MEKLKVILVDDELAARNVLKNLLNRCDADIEIVSSCSDIPEAVSSIKALNPDLVFLDVQMPNYAGYEIVNFFDELTFEIIFVTAYDQFAIKAFEINAIDYIVKPVERNRLDAAIKKAKIKLKQKNQIEHYRLLLNSIQGKELGKIVVSELSEGQVSKRVIQVQEIIAIEANGAYSKVHLENETPFLISRNLKYFESLLPEDGPFLRSHRSWILNLEHVLKFNPRFGDVKMTKGVAAKVSKSQFGTFEERTIQRDTL